MVGCIDLIRAYPTPDRAYLGLLLFAESHQGKGLGTQALHYITQQAAAWGCTHLRLGVVTTNLTGLAFWRYQGFVPLYQKPQAGYLGEIVVCERPVVAFRSGT
jgi:GNAT superfamily N-acetyltransferase